MKNREQVEVVLCDCVTSEWDKMLTKDPRRLARIEAAIARVEELGWTSSVKVKHIRVLKNTDGLIGEIRYRGKGEQRLLFFWVDPDDRPDVRQLFVTDSLPKSVLKDAVLRRHISRARRIRAQWIATGEC